MSDALPVGKLPPELLGELLAAIPDDPTVLIGAGIGRDAAAVRVSESILVLKSDPITFATEEIGWYAPNVNANDLACMGATPRWMLTTTLLPERSATPELVKRIFRDLQSACAALGVTLVGGHSEITTGLDRTILIGMMAGEARETDLVDPRRSRPGDKVLLARGIAIEGTALIARELADRLAPAVDEAMLTRARAFLHEPGISVVSAATALRQALGPDVHALHDPTEGGLATGLRELGTASGCGISVMRDEILIYPETAALCDQLDVDPLGLIASGALLAVIAPEAAGLALAALKAAGSHGSVIGHLLADPTDVHMLTAGREQPLPTFAVDEIARLFSSTS